MVAIAKNTNYLYPDLIALGGLDKALQSALRDVGSSLTVSEPNELQHNFFVYARVELGSRFSQISTASQERLFLLDFWARGVMLANGKSPNLDEIAQAIDKWVATSCTTSDLAAAIKFVSVEQYALAYERGEEVEERWQIYIKSILFPELVAFVEAASRRPQLRNLFPFTNHNRFCFSRCTGYPYTRDTPIIQPLKNGQYEVFSPSGSVLGLGNAEEAVELVVANLPPNCGPAVPGTADDLITTKP